jgi:hypothetical protein
MRVTSSVEHRVRGRVWLLFAAVAGGGALYTHEAFDRHDDKRELRVASNAVSSVQPRAVPTARPYYGGGPLPEPTQQPSTPTVETRSTEPVEEAAPTPQPSVEPAPATTVVIVAAVDDAGPPPEDAPPAPEDTGVEDAAPQVVATAEDAGVTYDPNVPYITPVYAFPAPPGALVGALQPPPEPVGAGGTAANPSINMAGGSSAGIVGAGGTAATPSATMAGGTSNPGLVGAGGTAAEPSTTMAGGTSIGATGAGGLSGPVTVPGVNPFLGPQTAPFATTVVPFGGAAGVTPFMGVPWFMYVAPMGAFGAVPIQ